METDGGIHDLAKQFCYLGGPGGLSSAAMQTLAKPMGDSQDEYFGGAAGSGM